MDLNRLVQAGPVQFDETALLIHHTIQSLPFLTKESVTADDACPICLMPFKSIFEDQGPSSVTQLKPCGHLFCRKDLVEWIKNRNGTCPTCRHVFLRLNPWSEWGEESDDGEYFPEEEDDDDDDEWSDGLSIVYDDNGADLAWYNNEDEIGFGIAEPIDDDSSSDGGELDRQELAALEQDINPDLLDQTSFSEHVS